MTKTLDLRIYGTIRRSEDSGREATPGGSVEWWCNEGTFMTYRKRKGIAYDTWHFCRNCSKWPTSNYDERNSEPTNGEKCDECKAKEKSGNCTKY